MYGVYNVAYAPYHVICLFYAVIRACFVPIKWVLGIIPAARRPPPAAFPPPLRLNLFFFTLENGVYLHKKYFNWSLYSSLSPKMKLHGPPPPVAQDVVPAAGAQDEAGPSPVTQDVVPVLPPKIKVALLLLSLKVKLALLLLSLKVKLALLLLSLKVKLAFLLLLPKM